MATPSIDRLSSLLERFRVRAHLFHAGPLCGVTHFDARPGRGFLHVLRRGEMALTHRAKSGAPRRIRLREPSLLFYPRPLAHDFHNAPEEGSDFVCAGLDFDGGSGNPLLHALPPLVVLRLARALSALHEHPGKPWSLERMAERAGMSRSAFAAGFKAAVGQTPANYLAHWRLMLAQAQLRQGRSIKAIADELGYANPSALSRLFTKKIGRSPRHWLTQQD